MTMQEFYEKYNLNKYNFAEIAGVGTKTLIKFDKGIPIREQSKLRIETAIRVAEKYDLKRPVFDYARGLRCGLWYRNDFHRDVYEYTKQFKQLIEEETRT